MKSDEKFHLLDEAVLTKDTRLITRVYIGLQACMWRHWCERVPLLMHALRLVPNFNVELNWRFQCSSTLLKPLVNAFAPYDTYRIWKRGDWLRLDSTIVNMDNLFSVKRSELTMLFTGSGSERPGELLLLDRQEKTISKVA